MKQEKAVEILFKAFPYPEQIVELDMSEKGEIYFTWREERFKFSYTNMPFVWSVRGTMLHGDNISILAQELLTKQYSVI